MNSLLLSINWNPNPELFNLFGISIRYYGLLWAVGIFFAYIIVHYQYRDKKIDEKKFDPLFFYCFFGILIGARLGHCLFYDPGYYLTHPVEILYIHQGGLASHGAAVGLLVGLWLFSRKNKMPYIWSLDRIAIAVGIAGALVRIGNLMNSEIYGHATSLPWGFVFVRAGETQPMHPTQIYEAAAYLVLFGILCWMYYGPKLALRRPGLMFGFFLIYLFGFRFLVEFIKNPQEEFERTMTLNMGQWLSIPFIVLGIVILYRACRRPAVELPKTKR